MRKMLGENLLFLIFIVFDVVVCRCSVLGPCTTDTYIIFKLALAHCQCIKYSLKLYDLEFICEQEKRSNFHVCLPPDSDYLDNLLP